MTDREPSITSESIQHSPANCEAVAPSELADSVPAGSGPFAVLPTQFGRFRILKLLGSGAMGTVGLAHAHDRGIVHRDLKPANVMIDRRSEPVIMDFGLALRTDSKTDIRTTTSGMIVGSPAYMSPEQARGDHDQIGPWTDIYGLGV